MIYAYLSISRTQTVVAKTPTFQIVVNFFAEDEAKKYWNAEIKKAAESFSKKFPNVISEYIEFFQERGFFPAGTSPDERVFFLPDNPCECKKKK